MINYLKIQMTNINSAIKNSNIDTVDAKYLMCFVKGIEYSQLPLQMDMEISNDELNKFNELVEMRKNNIPVDVIIGEKGFWNGMFKVTADVLSPRPDSETIIESVLDEKTDKDKSYKILDIGTGSGCLLISLLSEYKNATGVGVDVSGKALEIAKHNADKNGVFDRCEFIQSDWFENIKAEKFDIIVSNPPYIPQAEIDTLQTEVKNHDPMIALTDYADGLESYRVLVVNLKEFMDNDSIFAVEFGYNQSDDVKEIFENNGYKMLKYKKDLSNIVRIHLYQK
ncbi:MAG: peptide chain release factor N(5)-glutamine methyltransferase [Alphaproteobacteria bacterium]